MKYIVGKVLRTLWWNRRISILMIAEIALGMSVFVYSANLFYSLSGEEAARKGQERDLVLGIYSDGDTPDGQAFTKEDYEKLQGLTGDKTFFYVAVPQFFAGKEENYEFLVILLDYSQAGLKEGSSYWGREVQGIVEKGVNPFPELQAQKMPEELESQRWKTETEEIALSGCVAAPVEYMEQMQDEISGAMVHAEWKSSELADAETVSREIERYLYAAHEKKYHYQVYAPETELKNHSYKVKLSIGMINKAGILSLVTFSFGMLGIFGLLFEHREEEFGIELACGADERQLCREIFLEILFLNGFGTVLGLLAGWVLTCYTDLGIMIGYIDVRGDVRTCLLGGMVCAAITVVVSFLIFGKLKNREIAGLLNGH